MANYERDKDDVRVYDGSEDDEDGEGSHLPVVIIIAILVLAAFGGVVWLAYNQGVARGRNEPVRLAAADTANPGNGIKVYQQPAGADDEDDAQAPAKNQQADAAPTPAQAAAQVSARADASAPPATVAQASPSALAPAKPQPQPPVVATKPPAQLGLAHPAPEVPAAKAIAPKPVATAPTIAPKTAVATPPKAAVAVPPKATAAVPPKAAAATPPKPVAAAPVATAPKAVPSGSYLLQVGAYKSEAEAMAAWKTYQVKHATLLAGFGPDVQRADLGDKGVWYRLRISSFADKDAATALCERLKAQNGACFLAR